MKIPGLEFYLVLFHGIQEIFIDLDFVKSLPSREFFSGMAEIIKCAMIADLDFFEFLENEGEAIRARDPIVFEQVMLRTIRIKESHVFGDVREKGKRLLLNFGHTLGHAIEMASQNESEEALRHGEGVALGMISIVQICQKYLNLDASVLKRLESILKCYELPTSFSSSSIGWNSSDLIKRCLDLVQKDKKRKKVRSVPTVPRRRDGETILLRRRRENVELAASALRAQRKTRRRKRRRR